MSSGNIILFKFTSDEHLYIKQKEPIRSKEFNILAMGNILCVVVNINMLNLKLYAYSTEESRFEILKKCFSCYW